MRETLKYLVVYEKSADGFNAYVPDLPGCTSSAQTRNEIESNIIEAILLHIETMNEEGLEKPKNISDSQMIVIL